MKNTTKILCFIVILSLLYQNYIWAHGISYKLPDVSTAVNLQVSDLDKLRVPYNLGKIKEVWKSSALKAKKIIHIQDSHANYEVQKNIAKILERLGSDTLLVALEGTEGLIDTSQINSVPSENVRYMVSNYLMENGLMDGAEFYSAMQDWKNKDRVILCGVEREPIYNRNLELFKKVDHFRASFKRLIQDGINKLVRKSKSILAPEQSEFILQNEAYYDDRISLEEYVRYLSNQKPVTRNQTSNFTKIIRLIKLKEKIDFTKVEEERMLLLKYLKKRLVGEQLKDIIVKGLDYQVGSISAVEYFSCLEKWLQDYRAREEERKNQWKNKTAGEKKDPFGNLESYIYYVKLEDKIDRDKLFKELRFIEDRLRKELFKRPSQKELSNMFRCLIILKKFSELKIYRSDLNYYKTHKINFLRLIGSISISYSNQKRLEYFVAVFEEFCNMAVVRDRILTANTLAKMSELGLDSAVLITGGFHTDGIRHCLKRDRTSYAIVSPHMNKPYSKERYVELMLDRKSVIEKVLPFSGTRIKPPSALESLWEYAEILINLCNIYDLIQKKVPLGRIIPTHNSISRLRQKICPKIKEIVNYVQINSVEKVKAYFRTVISYGGASYAAFIGSSIIPELKVSMSIPDKNNQMVYLGMAGYSGIAVTGPTLLSENYAFEQLSRLYHSVLDYLQSGLDYLGLSLNDVLIPGVIVLLIGTILFYRYLKREKGDKKEEEAKSEEERRGYIKDRLKEIHKSMHGLPGVLDKEAIDKKIGDWKEVVQKEVPELEREYPALMTELKGIRDLEKSGLVPREEVEKKEREKEEMLAAYKRIKSVDSEISKLTAFLNLLLEEKIFEEQVNAIIETNVSLLGYLSRWIGDSKDFKEDFEGIVRKISSAKRTGRIEWAKEILAQQEKIRNIITGLSRKKFSRTQFSLKLSKEEKMYESISGVFDLRFIDEIDNMKILIDVIDIKILSLDEKNKEIDKLEKIVKEHRKRLNDAKDVIAIMEEIDKIARPIAPIGMGSYIPVFIMPLISHLHSALQSILILLAVGIVAGIIYLYKKGFFNIDTRMTEELAVKIVKNSPRLFRNKQYFPDFAFDGEINPGKLRGLFEKNDDDALCLGLLHLARDKGLRYRDLSTDKLTWQEKLATWWFIRSVSYVVIDNAILKEELGGGMKVYINNVIRELNIKGKQASIIPIIADSLDMGRMSSEFGMAGIDVSGLKIISSRELGKSCLNNLRYWLYSNFGREGPIHLITTKKNAEQFWKFPEVDMPVTAYITDITKQPSIWADERVARIAFEAGKLLGACYRLSPEEQREAITEYCKIAGLEKEQIDAILTAVLATNGYESRDRIEEIEKSKEPLGYL